MVLNPDVKQWLRPPETSSNPRYKISMNGRELLSGY